MAAKRRKITCADAIADILKFVEEDEDEDLNELDSDDDNEGADDMDELYGSHGMFIIYHMKNDSMPIFLHMLDQFTFI